MRRAMGIARRPFTLVRNVVTNVRRFGFKYTLKLYRYRLAEKYRDSRLGIRTMGLLHQDVSAHDSDNNDYEAIDYRCLDIAFRHLNLDANNEVFLDYGCGKGRAVVVAAMHPFRRVIGIELSPELCDIAKENVRRAARKLECPDVEIVAANAMDYVVPSDVTVVFLFNPFQGRVLATVQKRIRQSLIRSPRRLRIVYMHPAKEPNGFADCDWLTKQSDLPTANWDNVRYMVYENNREMAARDDRLPIPITDLGSPSTSEMVT